jgi:hypothetical protein
VTYCAKCPALNGNKRIPYIPATIKCNEEIDIFINTRPHKFPVCSTDFNMGTISGETYISRRYSVSRQVLASISLVTHSTLSFTINNAFYKPPDKKKFMGVKSGERGSL